MGGGGGHHIAVTSFLSQIFVVGLFYSYLYLGKPRIESKKRTKIQLNAGGNLTMDCMSSGYPTPVITWRRLDGRPLPMRAITHSKGLLSIHYVGQLDRGEYQCISSNSYGNDSRIFSVNMIGTVIIYQLLQKILLCFE